MTNLLKEANWGRTSSPLCSEYHLRDPDLKPRNHAVSRAPGAIWPSLNVGVILRGGRGVPTSINTVCP